MMKAAKNTWNFLKQLATLAHGCASETHLSMDANMRRLPKESIIYMETLYLIFDYPYKYYTFKLFEVQKNTHFTTNIPRLNEP